MKEECKIGMIWFTWLGIPILSIGFGISQGWWAAAFILIVGVLGQIFYIRSFPQLSKFLGYGSVNDVTVESTQEFKSLPMVTLYTANVCPFCPIVKQRLINLQRDLKFELQEIDITFKPSLIKEKGFQSVPIIEIEGDYWVGNATSAQILSFIAKHNQ